MASTSSTPPPTPAGVQHFPAVPSYVVALSVVAAVVVTALVLFILYNCLVQRSKKRSNVEQSPTRETEQLREDTAVEHDVPLDDTATEVTLHVKPKPSPSIFSRGDFLMEVLEGVENTTDLSIDDDVGNSFQVCEADRVTVAMDDLKEDSISASPVPSTPPRQSASMDIFLENLSTLHVNPTRSTRSTLGLRVREDGQAADASTQALRGSISSGEGGSGSEGGEVIVCADIEIYEDPVVGGIYEDPAVGEICEDLVMCLVKEVEIGTECHEDDTDEMVNGDDMKEKGSCNENKSIAGPIEKTPSLYLSHGCHENVAIVPEVDLEENEDESVPASKCNIREEKLYSVEVGDTELAEDIKEDEDYEKSSPCSLTETSNPRSSKMLDSTSSPLISGQEESCSKTPPQSSTCSAELELTPAPSIPVNIIPVSNQKVSIPNTASAQLSHSTPTSLLHPLVSMHALPLTERALSVSHLSLNRSGKHLPATPLSCNSDYSPVYNMQAGSAMRLARGGGGQTM